MDFRLSPDQELLVQTATRLAQERFARDAFRRNGFAWDSLRTLADAGFTGIAIPASDGGQGGSMLDAVLVLDAISRVCPHSGDAVQASNFGAIRQLATYGSAEVKQAVLPDLLAGRALITAGMSEPDAGSDLLALRTRARIEGDEIVIDGEKCWNSHGPEATHVVVWCRFGPRTRDIGAVVLPTDAVGLEKGPPQRYMSGEQHCSLHFDGCRVPRSWALAERDGPRRLLSTFGIERLGNAVRALALAETAFSLAVDHAKGRRQFGRRLCEFQGIQWKFADMRVKLDAARLLVLRAVSNADSGSPDPLEVAVAKANANEAAFAVANEALQVFGAAGYDTGLPLEYLFRRIRGWMIAGGSVEMMRNRIADAVFGERFEQRPTVSVDEGKLH